MLRITRMGLAALAALCFQLTATALAMRAQQKVGAENTFIPAAAVVVGEAIKAVMSVVGLFLFEAQQYVPAAKGKPQRSTAYKVARTARVLASTARDMLIPSCSYTLQNILITTAYTTLPPLLALSTLQMKVISTAFFARLMLNRRLSWMQLLSLPMVMSGVILMTLGSQRESAHKGSATVSELVVAEVAMVAGTALSGFGGTYVERQVKVYGQRAGMWVRNVQLSVLGTVAATAGMYLKDGARVRAGGMLQGFSMWAWAGVALYACSGIITSMCVKHADNILKIFATSSSMVITGVLASMLFGDEVGSQGLFGGLLIVSAITLYSSFPIAQPGAVDDAKKES
ncbi:unnamed protein product [Pedinophyceae sp. YPF-701]|nr:unnamed protein product [Pedinophyceae sp. YPF-701]